MHTCGEEMILLELFIGTLQLAFETGSLAGLELTNKARLASQGTARIHLSNFEALRSQAFTTMLRFLLLVDWFVFPFMWVLGTKLRFSC